MHKKKQLTAILIVTEDEKSSKYYLRERAKQLGLTNAKLVQVKKSKGSSPNKVVETAIEECESHNSNTKCSGEIPYSRVYCVMDVDNHDADSQNPSKNKLRTAIDKIRNKNKTSDYRIFSIVSNECFETWYALHFKELGDTKPIKKPSSKKVKIHIPNEERYDKLLESYLGKQYKKTADFGAEMVDLISKHETKAIKNAKWLANYHLENQTNDTQTYHANPSSDVYLLIEDLLDLYKQNNPIAPVEDVVIINDLGQHKDLYENEYVLRIIAFINEYYNQQNKETKLDHIAKILAIPYEVINVYPDELQVYVCTFEQIYKK